MAQRVVQALPFTSDEKLIKFILITTQAWVILSELEEMTMIAYSRDWTFGTCPDSSSTVEHQIVI